MRSFVLEGTGQGQGATGMPSRGSIASGAVESSGSRGSITGFFGGTARLAFTQGAGASAASPVGISYSYDGLYRLTDAIYTDGHKFHYDYDAVGNILARTQTIWNQVPVTTTYLYDPANRLSSVNGTPYYWDNNGNLTSDGTAAYGYDAANRLTTISKGGHTHAYTYDGDGDRLTQSLDGVVTRYTLDLNTGLTQVLSDGTDTYLYGVGRIGELQPGGFLYHLTDALGSVRQLVDSTGQVQLAERYEPYGSVLDTSGMASSAYAFTGEMYDTYIKLLDLRSRWYDPATGRFTTRDVWPGDYNRPQSLDGWTYTLSTILLIIPIRQGIFLKRPLQIT